MPIWISDLLGEAGRWIPVFISVAALWVSLRANRHAKRSADSSERSARASELSAQAAQETAQIDRERHHSEQKPIFEAKSESIEDRGQRIGGMWVKLIKPDDLDEVKVRFERPADREPLFVRQITVMNTWTLSPGEETPEGRPLKMGERFNILPSG